MVELLERSLKELSAKYGYEIEGKYTFEIYPNHDDFAVRTLGLPRSGRPGRHLRAGGGHGFANGQGSRDLPLGFDSVATK